MILQDKQAEGYFFSCHSLDEQMWINALQNTVPNRRPVFLLPEHLDPRTPSRAELNDINVCPVCLNVPRHICECRCTNEAAPT